VLFVFKQKNHTVTQSSFDVPCTPLDHGIDTGLYVFWITIAFISNLATSTNFVADNETVNFPTYELEVKDSTTPIWIHCKQPVGAHCSKGMVFAVNPQGRFELFQAAANATALNATSSSSSIATSTRSWPAELSSSVVPATATPSVEGHVWTTTYGSWPGSAAPTAAAPVDHQVTVGGTGVFLFTPENVQAQPGDTITFNFQVKNHTGESFLSYAW
jgi:hypothetical protein